MFDFSCSFLPTCLFAFFFNGGHVIVDTCTCATVMNVDSVVRVVRATRGRDCGRLFVLVMRFHLKLLFVHR